jgi:hypothetical protein
MDILERGGGRSARGKELSTSRNRQSRPSLYGDGSVVRRMQELVDTLAWIRIELAAAASAPQPKTGATRQDRALAKMDSALDIAKQLVFDLDAELRTARDEGTAPST